MSRYLCVGSFAVAGSGNIDALFGTVDYDTLCSLGGNDSLNGGAGTDPALYFGNPAGYTTAKMAIVWAVSSVAEVVDTLTNIERLKFGDTPVATDLDVDQSVGKAALSLGEVLGKNLMLGKQPCEKQSSASLMPVSACNNSPGT